MEKEKLRLLIAGQIQARLQTELSLDEYIDEVFALSMGILFDKIKANDFVSNILIKVREKIKLQDLINTNDRFALKSLGIVCALVKLKVVDPKNLWLSSFCFRQEFNAFDLYILSELKKLPYFDKLSLPLDFGFNLADLFETKIQAMLKNINILQDEAYAFLDFYQLANYGRLSAKTENLLQTYFWACFIKDKDCNHLFANEKLLQYINLNQNVGSIITNPNIRLANLLYAQELL